MARALYRGYRSARTTRLHVIRDTPVAAHRASYRALHQSAVRQTWCGQGAGLHKNSEPVIFDPMPEKPPQGLSWCPACIGHLAEELGLLGEVAAWLAAHDPGASS